MENRQRLVEVLKKNSEIEEDKLYTKIIEIEDLSFMKLRDCLMAIGTILEEDEESHVYVVTIKAGLFGNEAWVVVELNNTKLTVIAYAKEGVVKQNTANRAVEKIELQICPSNNTEQLGSNRKTIKFTIVCLVVIIAVVHITSICIIKYESVKLNEAVKEYNEYVDVYNQMAGSTAITQITNMTDVIKKEKEINISWYEFTWNMFKQAKKIKTKREQLSDKLKSVQDDILVIVQITNPSENWIIDRIGQLEKVMDMEAVTEDNDPNGNLGIEGGYTSCVYFSISGIDQAAVKGDSIVEKGTDAGGAVEVYKTVEDAIAREKYLAEFDNTILYSGSHTVIGTMVVRTSYMLSEQQQLELTNIITEKFTEIK